MLLIPRKRLETTADAEETPFVSLFLLDTDHLTLYQMGHPQVLQHVARHLTDQLAISVITVEEQLTGWQRALYQAKDDGRREQVYRRLALTVEALSGWPRATALSCCSEPTCAAPASPLERR